MEAGLAGDFRIVQQRRIQVDLAFVGAAAEEIHRAAAPHHVHRPLPGLRLADRFNGHVHAAPVRHAANLPDRVAMLSGDNQVVRARRCRAIELRLAPAHRDHAAAVEFRQLHEHQPDRPQADNRHGVARQRRRFFETADHARQRLHQRRVLVPHALGNYVGIALHDARWNFNVLGVRAVIEKQIFAKILQAAMAEETLSAGRRIGRHHPLPDRKLRHALAERHDIPRQFVPEHSRGHDHSGVIAAPEDLDVGAAGERHLYAYEDVPALNSRNSYRLYLQMLLAVKHGGHHVVIHLGPPLWLNDYFQRIRLRMQCQFKPCTNIH